MLSGPGPGGPGTGWSWARHAEWKHSGDLSELSSCGCTALRHRGTAGGQRWENTSSLCSEMWIGARRDHQVLCDLLEDVRTLKVSQANSLR